MTSGISDFYHIKDDIIYLKPQGFLPERKIGEVKESETDTVTYFTNRFEKLVNKIDAVQKQIEENDNKGSFLQKINNLQNSLTDYDAIGDFISLSDRLKNLQTMLEDYIQQNRKRNLEVKNTLIEEAKSYASNPNWKEATEQLKELRQRWIKVGAVANDLKDTVEAAFQKVYDDFFKRKQDFHEAKQAMMDSRIEAYTNLIEKAKALNKAEAQDIRKQTDQLIEGWKTLGHIPKGKYDKLLSEFKKLTNSKGNKGKKHAQKNGNKEDEKAKLLLVAEQINALKLPVDEALTVTKSLQEKWKKLSHVFIPKEKLQAYFDNKDYIFEKHFLNSLFERKSKKGITPKEASKIKMNLLRDLISRDQGELLVFEENMDKFNMDSAKIDKMVNGKFERLKKKLKTKERLLNDLRDDYKKLQ